MKRLRRRKEKKFRFRNIIFQINKMKNEITEYVLNTMLDFMPETFMLAVLFSFTLIVFPLQHPNFFREIN